MYLVVIGILAIVLTLTRPLYRFVTEPGLVLAAATLVTLLPGIVGLLVSRHALRKLDRHPNEPSRGQAAFGRGMWIIQILLAAGHGALLVCTDWLILCDRIPVVGSWPVVPGLVALLPFLMSMVLAWICVYPADRAVRQIAVELYLLRGRPLRPVWPLLQFLMYNLRHQVLFVLIPMLLILAAHDIVVMYEDPIKQATRLKYAPDLLIGMAAILVAIIAPEILRHVWSTSRLPAGPLRDRLMHLSRKLNLRWREVLVWRSGGMIVNAAVMGVVAPLRYVLITDAMLEQMDDTRIEAVFGHEAGHVKRHHILFFLMFALISGCIVTIFSLRTRMMPRTDWELYQVLVTILGAFMLVKWGVVFGWISRRFERQADVYGVRVLAKSGLPCVQPCHLHASDENPGHRPRGDALCATAAHVFGQALHEVAVLNGIRPEAWSWRHSSIASRARFLHELAMDPMRTQRFERRVLWIKIAIFTCAAIGSIWAAGEMGIWHAVASLLGGA